MHETLGDTLKKARQAAGVSVEDVSFRAKIPRPVIEALEAEDFGFFTSPLYARSFLKQYGEYIGADIEPWLNDFVPSVMFDSGSVESILGGGESVSEHSEPASTAKNLGALWGPILIFLITLAIIWAGVKIFEAMDSQNQQTAPTEEMELPIERRPLETPQPVIENEPVDPDAPKRATIVEEPQQ